MKRIKNWRPKKRKSARPTFRPVPAATSGSAPATAFEGSRDQAFAVGALIALIPAGLAVFGIVSVRSWDIESIGVTVVATTPLLLLPLWVLARALFGVRIGGRVAGIIFWTAAWTVLTCTGITNVFAIRSVVYLANADEHAVVADVGGETACVPGRSYVVLTWRFLAPPPSVTIRVNDGGISHFAISDGTWLVDVGGSTVTGHVVVTPDPEPSRRTHTHQSLEERRAKAFAGANANALAPLDAGSRRVGEARFRFTGIDGPGGPLRAEAGTCAQASP